MLYKPQFRLEGAPLGRRDFLRTLGGSVAGLSAAGLLAACSEDGPELLAPGTGEIQGKALHVDGGPAAIGQVYLLTENGMQTGRFAAVQADGTFRFTGMEPGEYQLRFHAPRQGRVGRDYPNPIRVSVRPDEVAYPVFRGIVLGVFNENMIEIYIGDDFFQEQPVGELNSTTAARIGQIICWYHVGKHPHNVVADGIFNSGRMENSQAFIWEVDRTGFVPYRCTYHLPQMMAALQIDG